MKISRLEKKSRRQHNLENPFRLKKEIDVTTVKNIRNLFRVEEENKSIKYRIFRYIRKLFGHRGDYNKPLSVGNFLSNNYIEYDSNGDTNKILSVQEYLNKVRPYLKDITNDLKKSDTWEVQLTIAINLMFSKVMI